MKRRPGYVGPLLLLTIGFILLFREMDCYSGVMGFLMALLASVIDPLGIRNICKAY